MQTEAHAMSTLCPLGAHLRTSNGDTLHKLFSRTDQNSVAQLVFKSLAISSRTSVATAFIFYFFYSSTLISCPGKVNYCFGLTRLMSTHDTKASVEKRKFVDVFFQKMSRYLQFLVCLIRFFVILIRSEKVFRSTDKDPYTDPRYLVLCQFEEMGCSVTLPSGQKEARSPRSRAKLYSMNSFVE